MTDHEMHLANLRYLFHEVVNHELSLKLIDAWLLACLDTEESKLGEVPNFHDRGFDADVEVDRRADR